MPFYLKLPCFYLQPCAVILIFPFLAMVFYKRSILSLFTIAIVGGLFLTFPSGIPNGFLFWLMGWLAAMFGRATARVRWWHILISVVVFGVSLASTKFISGFVSELVVAVPTMILLVVLPYVNLTNRLLVRGISGLSDMSYSLYLFHFPFVAFCWFVFIAPSQLQPSVFSYGQFFAMLALTLIFCFTMWWLFERHTGHLRELLKNGLKAVR